MLEAATVIQTIRPSSIGLNPVFSIFLKFEFRPMAVRAIIIINLPVKFIY
jgi:hypothetical protein